MSPKAYQSIKNGMRQLTVQQLQFIFFIASKSIFGPGFFRLVLTIKIIFI
jgi:hypothetical protein